jgi:hypothetical protein
MRNRSFRRGRGLQGRGRGVEFTCPTNGVVGQVTRNVYRYQPAGSGLLCIAVPELDCGDFAVPVSAKWDGGVLMNQFPLAVSPLEAISFAHHETFCIARL